MGQTGFTELAERERSVVEAIDHAIGMSMLLAKARDDSHLNSSKAKAVARELGELRKVVTAFAVDQQTANSLSTVNKQSINGQSTVDKH